MAAAMLGVLGTWLLCAPPIVRAQQAEPRDRIDQAAALLMAQGAPAALKLLEPLLDDPAASDPHIRARVLFHVGWAHFQLNDYPKALDWYARARDASRAAGDRTTEARAVFGLAQARKNRGEYGLAVEIAREALALYEELGDAPGSARGWQLLGSLEDLTGRHREALASYERARGLYGGEQSQAAIRLLNEIAITHKNLGNYQEAVALYTEAFERLTAIEDRYGQAMVLSNLGKVHELLGQPDLAISSYQRSLTIARAINERRGQSMLLGSLGSTLMRRGDLARAGDYLQQQLLLTRELGNRNEEADALAGLGELHAARGEAEPARARFASAMAIQREIGARTRLGSTLLALADLDLAAGDPAGARPRATEALDLAHATGTPELEWKARLSLAKTLRAQGHRAEALAELRLSAAIINDLRANVWSDAGKIGFVDERQEVFLELASTLLAEQRGEEALEAAEAGRARAFADLLEQRQVQTKPEGVALLADVRAALDAARRGQAADVLAGSVGAATGNRSGPALDRSLTRLRATDRELASLITAESPTYREVAQLAARLDATFVEYLVTDTGLLSWVVSPDGAVRSSIVAVTRASLEALVRDVQGAMESPTRSSSSVRAPLRELHRLLVAPIAAWLPAQPDRVVVIVPHGPLALAPFAALEDEGSRPLLERHTLAFAPSIAVYRYTADKRRGSGDDARPALVLADPVPPPDSSLTALPGARDEGKRVVGRLGPAAARLLTGAAASEATVKRDAPSHRILHFATHGLASSDYPLASSLLLAEGEGEDGYLRADEIFALPLAADLVVLSGCSTGAGRVSGDGIIGLGRAFIYAGAPAVIVSQWSISDRATAYLMDQFYAALGRGLGTAAALRLAQLDTRRRFPDPALWAAFLVVGEPR